MRDDQRLERKVRACISLACLAVASCAREPAQVARPAIARDSATRATIRPVEHLPPTRPAAVDATWRDQHPAIAPPQAILAGHHGTTIVLAQIGVDGKVLATQVEHSTGYAELDDTAVAAVRGWKFQPCYTDNQPQACWTRESVWFSPPNNPAARALKLTIVQPGYSVSPEHPRYTITWPRDELGKPLTGTTVLWLKVGGEQGQVMSASIDKSSGHGELDAAALEASHRWHFTPAYDGGVAVEGFVRVPIVMDP